MPHWLTDEKVLAALISALISAIGVVVSALNARRAVDTQVKLKSKELEAQAQLKSRELEAQAEAIAARLRAEQEALRQEQLTQILKKRIETYPALYEIISVYGRNWEIEGETRDHVWAKSFLKALIDNNAKNGAFFSKRVYQWYGELRTFLEGLEKDLATGGEATDDQIAKLYDIIRGPILPSGDARAPGLGSYIKDELGSYVTVIVSATYPHYEAPNPTAINEDAR